MELYIHIPFCIRKCAYCDFLSGPADERTQAAYMEALLREIQCAGAEHKERLAKGIALPAETEVTSVFFGGGTPSAVKPEWIACVMETVRENFSLTADAEISMEANPGTLTEEKLCIYRRAGINRLSIGLQSTDDEELKRIGRIHTYEEFLQNYQLARVAGFTNLNIDLMSALPEQTVDSYEKTLRRVIALRPEHISAYSLIIEEGTPFWERYGERPELLPSEEEDRQMYHLTKKILGEAGYRRYEISNYAKPGYECRHNVGYWTRVPYLGLGLGASSYYGSRRFSNTREMKRYLENPGSQIGQETAAGDQAAEGKLSIEQSVNEYLAYLREEIQELTDKDAMEEFMFLGLRLTAGIRAIDFRQSFGREIESVYGSILTRMCGQGLLKKTAEGWRLTEWGLDVSNSVLAEFLLD